MTTPPVSFVPLDKLTVAFHWLVALSILGLLALGFYMYDGRAYELYDLHKSLGVLVFLVVLARVAWRIKKGWPVPVREYAKFEQALSRVVHWVLIVSTVLMPISGMAYSSFKGHGFAVFGLTIVPENHAIADPTEVVPHSEPLYIFFHDMHFYLGWVMAVAIGLHLLGALKHHLVDRDGTLRRMLGRAA